MCLCRKRPCCRFLWSRCTFCAYNIFSIRVLLILFSITDIIIMLWYLWAIEESRDQITNCCGITNNYPQPSINSTSLNSNYSTCSDLDYTNNPISSYYDIISPFSNHFISNMNNYDWTQFSSIFTDYDINITVDSNGGCIYNPNTQQTVNCLSDTVMPCVEYFNESNADSINHELESMCFDNLSDKEEGYITLGILGIVMFKVLIIMIGLCCKLCRQEMRPENEYIRNLLRPSFIPSFSETHRDLKRKQTQALLHRLERIDSTPGTERRTEKSETIDMNGAKSYYVYYRMEDQRKNRNICCKLLYAFCSLLYYIYLFIYWIFKIIKWIISTSYWLILLIINFIFSVDLFIIHHSPILGADGLDFCADSYMNDACNVGQNQCGVINWIILPDVTQYLLPRYLTLIIAFCACLGRCIERCAGFRLQELVARKEVDVRDLNVNDGISNAFQRISVTSHNKNIASQFTAKNGDQMVEDLSVTNPSHIEMSNTESLPLNTSQSKNKKKKLFSSLDILEDHRSTIHDEDDDAAYDYDENDDGGHHDDSLLDANDRDNDIVTDDEDDDIEQSQSQTIEKKEEGSDVLETDFYDSIKTGTTTSDAITINNNNNNDVDKNKDLKVVHEEKHSLRGDLALFNQDRNRGDSQQRRKFSL